MVNLFQPTMVKVTGFSSNEHSKGKIEYMGNKVIGHLVATFVRLPALPTLPTGRQAAGRRQAGSGY
jgi:hypothetical protein